MKIAVVGSAPSSVHLAPYADPSWKIWACSPAAVGHVRRSDEWFELHRFDPGRFATDYILHLGMHPGPVQMLAPVREVPASVAFDKAPLLAEFGPYFFTSTIAWMLGAAILKKPVELGLYGIDMSASDEYADQRPGCHFFIQEAKRRGITVTVPPESDILRPPPLYGFREIDPVWRKLQSKSDETRGRLKAAQDAARANELHGAKLEGANQMLEYFRRTFV